MFFTILGYLICWAIVLGGGGIILFKVIEEPPAFMIVFSVVAFLGYVLVKFVPFGVVVI